MSKPTQGRPSLYPPSGPGSVKRRRWFLVVSALLLVAALWVFRSVLLPFLLAIILAYVLSPLVEIGERLVVMGRRPRRWMVVLALYLGLVSGLATLLATTIPQLSEEFTRLAEEAPQVVAKARNQWLPELDRRLRSLAAPYRAASRTPVAPTADAVNGQEGATPSIPVVRVTPRPDGSFDVTLPEEGIAIRPAEHGGYRLQPASKPYKRKEPDLATTITTALSRAIADTERGAFALVETTQHVVAALGRGVFAFVMMLMLSAYILVSTDSIFEFVRSHYPPSKRHQFDDLVRRLDRGLAGVVRGQLTISLVNGVLSGIGFYLLGLKYWVFLTILAAVMSIIPIFGSILSTVPAVLVALPEGFGLALLVLAWVVGIHQIEANLLNPKIMGDAARVHPVLVVFALLAGEKVAGIAGALFAVPVLSISQTLFFYLRERHLGVPRPPSVPPPPGQQGSTSIPTAAPPRIDDPGDLARPT